MGKILKNVRPDDVYRYSCDIDKKPMDSQRIRPTRPHRESIRGIALRVLSSPTVGIHRSNTMDGNWKKIAATGMAIGRMRCARLVLTSAFFRLFPFYIKYLDAGGSRRPYDQYVDVASPCAGLIEIPQGGRSTIRALIPRKTPKSIGVFYDTRPRAVVGATMEFSPGYTGEP